MKIASFKAATGPSYGIVTDAGVIDAGRRLKDFPTLKALLAKGSLDALNALKGERADYTLKDVELLPTVPDPDKIFCVGVNYADAPRRDRPARHRRTRRSSPASPTARSATASR